MKLLFAFLLYIISYSSGISQIWVPKADYPGAACDDGTSFTIGNKAYCGTGMTPWFSTSANFFAFDFNTETWSTTTPLPSGLERQYAVGLSDQSFGYLFGGTGNGNFYNDVWKFDPTTAVWTQLSSMPDSGRSGSTGFIINDTIYIIGGTKTIGGAIADVWAYSINNDTWERKNDLPYTIWTAKSTAVNGKGYLTFGTTDNGSFPENLLEYTPQTDSWSNLPPYPEGGHSHGSLVSSGSFLLTMGGRDSLWRYSKYLYRYDIVNQIWQQLSAIPDSARKGGMTFINNEQLYYTTGITAQNQRLRQTWKCADAFISNTEFAFSELKIFPNPMLDVLTVQINASDISDKSQLIISDIHGKIWMVEKISSKNTKVDTSLLPLGLYFASLNSGSNFKTIRLLKTH